MTSGVYGPFSTCGSSGFLGTSAASPHTAGAAALVKEANPGSRAAQLRSFLESRAGALGAGGHGQPVRLRQAPARRAGLSRRW